jgi:hypothetical protein
METLQKYLSSIVVQVFYTLTDYNGSLVSNPKAGKGKMMQLLTLRKNRTLQKKKAETIRLFHLLVNAHLLIMLVLGIFFPINSAHKSLYHCVCLCAGWLFYHTMDVYVTQAYTLKENKSGQGYFPAAGLYGLAGYNRKTRLGLLILVALAIVATLSTHISFALLTGFCLRWLLESQMQVLVAPPNGKHSLISVV